MAEVAKTHVAVLITAALHQLERGNNVLDCTPNKAIKLLTDAENKGYRYYSPTCDNVDETGRCKGHI